MVTKKDIAKYLGISRTSVSLVLNNTPGNTISTETKNKIRQAAKYLGYRNTEVSAKICYVLYERPINDPRYMVDVAVMEEAASLAGYGLLFMNVNRSSESMAKLQRSIDELEIQGYIISGDVDDRISSMFRSSSTPYIFYGLNLPEQAPFINYFTFDYAQIACSAANYLFSLGHRHIALFLGSLDYPIHQLMLEGFSRAYDDHKQALDKSLIQISNEENGYELCRRAEVLRLEYTAVVCGNTVIQFGALQYLQSKGISVPDSISLIGLDQSEFVKFSVPQLTTYHFTEEGKKRIVPMLHELIVNGIQSSPVSMITKEFKLFEGGTVALPST